MIKTIHCSLLLLLIQRVLSQVVELIENKQSFGITTHIKPDGDGVGSSLGLCWLLRSLGKSAEVVVRGDVPIAYKSLPGADEIRDVHALLAYLAEPLSDLRAATEIVALALEDLLST